MGEDNHSNRKPWLAVGCVNLSSLGSLLPLLQLFLAAASSLNEC